MTSPTLTRIDTTGCAVGLVDLSDGSIASISNAWLDHLGLPAEAVVGRPGVDLVRHDKEAGAQVPAEALGFEVTETLLIEHFDYAADVMSRIRRLGCPVGLDDFGTGYSSLSYLRRLPLDFIKIEGDLVAGIDSDGEARSIVGAIIAMAAALDLDVIAEGVETATQAATLAELGCPHAQGYLFGRPTRPDPPGTP